VGGVKAPVGNRRAKIDADHSAFAVFSGTTLPRVQRHNRRDRFREAGLSEPGVTAKRSSAAIGSCIWVSQKHLYATLMFLRFHAVFSEASMQFGRNSTTEKFVSF
jgi:hypothetical protein